jgi:glycerol-3-phosphate dehydrogenase (NAD(P)+)
VRQITSARGSLDPRDQADLAASVELAICDAVTDRTANAVAWFRRKYPKGISLVVSGGVAANKRLRRRLTDLADDAGLRFVAPPPELCTDNGAIIAWAGIERLRLGLVDGLDAPVRPRWPLDTDAPPRPGAGVKGWAVGLERDPVKRLAIVGGGAWGTALAMVARRAGSTLRLWARDPDVVAAINQRHQNPLFLPGVTLDPAITATTDMAFATERAEAALLVVPAQFLRGVVQLLGPHLPHGLPLLLCAKGIETSSLKMMSEVVAEILPASPSAVLSGPTFAAEVARELPTAVTIASGDASLGHALIEALGSGRFRPYLSQDLVGAEIGGAVKNVLAIACGIVVGRGLGDNARASLITRGLAEMIRLGVAKGGRAETFRGLSGLGDLVLTCSSAQSRNFGLGVALGRGRPLEAALRGSRSVVEGVASAASIARAAEGLGIEMPIAAGVDALLHRGEAVDTVIDLLLRRPYRAEQG